MPSADPVVCVDFGSTFTKAVLVDTGQGRIVASASHPTTIDTDVTDAVRTVNPSLGLRRYEVVPRH